MGQDRAGPDEYAAGGGATSKVKQTLYGDYVIKPMDQLYRNAGNAYTAVQPSALMSTVLASLPTIVSERISRIY